MKTIEIDILNEKALKLLQELEHLQLIRVRRKKTLKDEAATMAKYKGAMQKQPLNEVDNQLNELRSSWE
ncbi:MAG: hypothetical protein U5L09_15870 [Bacteroidales bacterium]|nr:hypothetical protein [Bacteroidales bacterium]